MNDGPGTTGTSPDGAGSFGEPIRPDFVQHSGHPQGAQPPAGQPSPGYPSGYYQAPVGPTAPPAAQSPATATSAPTRQRMFTWPTMIAVAALSASIGGGTALGVSHLLGSDVSTSMTPSTITRVVQASGTAPDWTVTASEAGKSAAAITVATGRGGSNGSGVVVDSAGHIVTNHHVVAAAVGTQSRILVQIGESRYPATIAGTDPTSDLAVLRLTDPPNDLVPIQFADSDKVSVGEPVMAIGNPLGLSGTVTTGIVSAVNRPVVTSDGSTNVFTNAIQTSAAINPGNSGGALVNVNGELIGINSSIASLQSSQNSQSGNIGIGFAIESNLVKSVTKQIIETGSANHSWLGVTATSETVMMDKAATAGARVTQVVDSSPAQAGGLRTGDVIVSVSGKPTSSLESLIAIVRSQPIGSSVEVSYIRGTEKLTTQVVLTASPR